MKYIDPSENDALRALLALKQMESKYAPQPKFVNKKGYLRCPLLPNLGMRVRFKRNGRFTGYQLQIFDLKNEVFSNSTFIRSRYDFFSNRAMDIVTKERPIRKASTLLRNQNLKRETDYCVVFRSETTTDKYELDFTLHVSRTGFLIQEISFATMLRGTGLFDDGTIWIPYKAMFFNSYRKLWGHDSKPMTNDVFKKLFGLKVKSPIPNWWQTMYGSHNDSPYFTPTSDLFLFAGGVPPF